MTEMKSILEGINRVNEAKGGISKLEDRKVELNAQNRIKEKECKEIRTV